MPKRIPQNLELSGKTAFVNALEMTISSWVDPEYPSAKPFRTQSAESMGALGKFEVVLGYVDPAFERSKAVERLERLAFA